MFAANAIYYTDKLHPIPVQVVKKNGERACVQIKTGKLFDVQANRLVTVLEPIRGNRINQSIKTKPPGYLSVVEYYLAHDLEIDDLQRKRMAQLCGWECRKAQIPSWKGKFQIMLYPETIIGTCYKKMICEVKS
jgi:hypothetical protein